MDGGGHQDRQRAGRQSGIRAKVWLAPRNADALDALATAVSDPSSPQFGQFLSEPQYRAQFAPTADQVAQVTRLADRCGPDGRPRGRRQPLRRGLGPAAAINAAFGTQLARYVVNGQPSARPRATSPAGRRRGHREAVSGLTTFGHRSRRATSGRRTRSCPARRARASTARRSATDLPKFQGKTLPFNICGYTADAAALAPTASTEAGTGGAGATVAITDAYDAPTLEADANTYSHPPR